MSSAKIYSYRVIDHQRTEEKVYLGSIQFSTIKDAFLEMIAIYNKNANRHISTSLEFTHIGKKYILGMIGRGVYSQGAFTGRYVKYWVLSCWSDKSNKWLDEYMYWIPVSKVKDKDAMKYITKYV